mgnify:CR=1 FL=1
MSTLGMSNSMSSILSGNSCAPEGNSFQSTRGNNITLGQHKKKFAEKSYDDFKTSMTYHDDGPRSIDHCPVNFEGGLSQTRFHKGFQRRSETNIHNPLHDQEKTYRTLSSQRSLEAIETRKNTLVKVASAVHYDIINGSCQPKKEKKPKPEGLRMNGDGLGSEAPNRGSAILRESPGRYFAPYPSGHNQTHRQDVLLREGVSKEKMTSIIQIGKGDLKSYGVDDQFCRSEYTKKPRMIGLYEMSRPGAYPHEKQRNNPSGNPKIVKGWAKGVTISNLKM